jgi:hypothetical protein
MALAALEGGAVLDERHRCFAVGTGEDFEQLGVDSHLTRNYNILR